MKINCYSVRDAQTANVVLEYLTKLEINIAIMPQTSHVTVMAVRQW